MSDQRFDSQNAAYVQLLYEQYALNPDSVPESWRVFFDEGPEATRAAGLLVPEGIEDARDNGGQGRGTVAVAPTPHAPDRPVPTSEEPSRGTELEAPTIPGTAGEAASREGAAPAVEEAAPEPAAHGLLPIVARATSFVQAFRDHGHMLAQLDPLGEQPPGHPQLDPAFFGTSMEEMEHVPASVIMSGAREESVAEALRRLRDAYAGSIGYEFEHLEDPERVRWLWSQVESGEHTAPLSNEEKKRLLVRLTEVEGFERFLHRAFLGQKRFSLEGNDTLVPMLDLALAAAAEQGGEEIVIGMAHRGRLNVLAHTVGLDYEDIISEFEGREGALHVPGTGDVKYHHGAEGVVEVTEGRSIHVTLVANPSHLEFVNPVVLGMTRLRQHGGVGHEAMQDTSAVVPILIHGDAAFAAEGVVAETLNLGRLDGYTVGGTVHIIVNNQIGFTTSPREGRSTRYASDLAKGYDFPIIHVNADEPDACLSAMRLAMAYRAEYGDDVVIDLVGYRRHGHNEGDEPAYTQPRLYEKIATHPTARALWSRRLVEEGVVTEDDASRIEDEVADTLRTAQDRMRSEPREESDDVEDGSGGDGTEAPNPADGPGRTEAPEATGAAEQPERLRDRDEEGDPDRPAASEEEFVPEDTGVPLETIEDLNGRALDWPEGFSVHPKLERSLEERRADFGADTRIEWAHAETLAFASLLREGFGVRLSGQDAQRGTFSQRHVVLHDVENGDVHTPLEHVGEGRFEIYNSPLTEAAVVGYEYGYSVAAERDLTLWEAQFGDFVNVAQVHVDQFVSSGKEKWDQHANLTLLLPHGYEGQGPEHSSARLERFLQLCAEDNMRVVYPTTPAQYFHLLRRQAHTRPEKPLIVMTPKSLLRLPAAASRVAELVEGSFRPVLDDPTVARDGVEDVTRLVLCSGKVYYDLQASEQREEASSVAIARVEELYPFPGEEVEALAARYPNLQQVVWTQEEPRNMGALTFVGPRLRAAIPRHVPLAYAARPERASPAEGKFSDHRSEQRRIIAEALGVEAPD